MEDAAKVGLPPARRDSASRRQGSRTAAGAQQKQSASYNQAYAACMSGKGFPVSETKAVHVYQPSSSHSDFCVDELVIRAE